MQIEPSKSLKGKGIKALIYPKRGR